MHWTDEGYLLSKNNFDENSFIIEAFTLKHGKYSGIVYGGSSSKQKRNFQIGNKIMLNWKSKGENRPGYFSIELIKAISPLFFDDKKRSICILSAASILKILLPERQINAKIYNSLEKMLKEFQSKNWIQSYIYWELSLIKDLGFEIDLMKINNSNVEFSNLVEINGKSFKVPKMLFKNNIKGNYNHDIKEALAFNKSLLLEYFIVPNKLKMPLSRNILENYYS